MAHWDDEQFKTQTPQKTQCATCKYRAKPVEVAGLVIDRSSYAMCDKYKAKPNDIVWGRTPCPLYEKE